MLSEHIWEVVATVDNKWGSHDIQREFYKTREEAINAVRDWFTHVLCEPYVQHQHSTASTETPDLRPWSAWSNHGDMQDDTQTFHGFVAPARINHKLDRGA